MFALKSRTSSLISRLRCQRTRPPCSALSGRYSRISVATLLKIFCRLQPIKPLSRSKKHIDRFIFYTNVIMTYLIQSDEEVTLV